MSYSSESWIVMDEVSAPAAAEGGGLRRFLRRLASSKAELEAEELQRSTGGEGATPIGECKEPRRSCVAGTLLTVTLRPHGGPPALAAQLFDATAVIHPDSLGRRNIPRIDPRRPLP